MACATKLAAVRSRLGKSYADSLEWHRDSKLEIKRSKVMVVRVKFVGRFRSSSSMCCCRCGVVRLLPMSLLPISLRRSTRATHEFFIATKTKVNSEAMDHFSHEALDCRGCEGVEQGTCSKIVVAPGSLRYSASTCS
jgi:hypothetical protein